MLEVAREVGAQAMLTAHHRDDQVETVLMHLLRGSGEVGSRGMLSSRMHEGVVLVRPLLAASRLQLQGYLAARGLPWRSDASNDDERFRRNHLRHAVLPLLEAAAPGFAAQLLDLAASSSAASGSAAIGAGGAAEGTPPHHRYAGRHRGAAACTGDHALAGAGARPAAPGAWPGWRATAVSRLGGHAGSSRRPSLDPARGARGVADRAAPARQRAARRRGGAAAPCAATGQGSCARGRWTGAAG